MAKQSSGLNPLPAPLSATRHSRPPVGFHTPIQKNVSDLSWTNKLTAPGSVELCRRKAREPIRTRQCVPGTVVIAELRIGVDVNITPPPRGGQPNRKQNQQKMRAEGGIGGNGRRPRRRTEKGERSSRRFGSVEVAAARAWDETTADLTPSSWACTGGTEKGGWGRATTHSRFAFDLSIPSIYY